MAINLDKVAFYSGLPAFKNDDSGYFFVSISGTIGVNGTLSWTGSTTFNHNNRMIRYSAQQNTVPSGVGYTINDRLPIAIMNSGGTFPITFGCSVNGSSSVTSAAADIYIKATQTTATATVSVHNPYSGNMVLTATTLTIYYTAFATFGEA